MNTTVKMRTEKDFKTIIEFLAEEHYGENGAIRDVLQYGFSEGYKEEFKFMELSNIIDVGYDEATDEEYINWLPFDDVNEKSLDYFLGVYYINFNSSWDRGGDVETRLFVKVDPEMTGAEFVTKYHSLKNQRQPLAVAIDNLHHAIDEKNLELMDKAKVSDEEWARFKAINDELEEMGV